ncbi:ATP-binding protein [Shigella sonnei]
MVGGGAIPGPGEISLAHNGVLFLMSYLNLNGVHWMPCESRLIRADPSFTHTTKITYPARFRLCRGNESQPYRTLSGKP